MKGERVQITGLEGAREGWPCIGGYTCVILGRKLGTYQAKAGSKCILDVGEHKGIEEEEEVFHVGNT